MKKDSYCSLEKPKIYFSLGIQHKGDWAPRGSHGCNDLDFKPVHEEII